jgi:hypothetical protein
LLPLRLIGVFSSDKHCIGRQTILVTHGTPRFAIK